MINAVLTSLLTHLAGGALAVAAWLSLWRPLPTSFLGFCALSSSSAALVAWWLSQAPTSWLGGALLLAGITWYLWLKFRGPSRGVGIATAAVALFALAAECTLPGSDDLLRLPGPSLCWISSLSSALLLGSVSVSMVLGHWYLVAPTLSIDPLRHGSLIFCATAMARSVGVLAVLALGGWEGLRIARWEDVIYSTAGLFFFIRALIGLLAPLLLAGFIWKTVKLRSTQSATGLLYVAVLLVLFGEMVAMFLTATTGFPL